MDNHKNINNKQMIIKHIIIICLLFVKKNNQEVIKMFKNILKNLRIERKLTQKQIATDLGISQPSYQQWEKGTRSPSGETLEKLADYFGVTTDFLLGREQNDDVYERLPIFSIRLRGMRQEKGLSQPQLAELVGVKIETYIDWEKGRKIPGPFAILKLGKVLEVNTEYLMGQSDYREVIEDLSSRNEKTKFEFFQEIEDIKTSKDEDKIRKKFRNIFNYLLIAAKEEGDKSIYYESFDFIFESFDKLQNKK